MLVGHTALAYSAGIDTTSFSCGFPVPGPLTLIWLRYRNCDYKVDPLGRDVRATWIELRCNGMQRYTDRMLVTKKCDVGISDTHFIAYEL